MSPTIWLGVAAVVSTGCLLWMVQSMRRQDLPDVLTFAAYAIFFRLMLSAFHPFTFPPIVGPFSINALYSLLVIGVGFQFVDHRLLRLRFLLPLYGLLGLIVVSAIYNGAITDSIQSLLKWLFFLVIVLSVYESLIHVGRVIVLETLLRSFSIPVILQLLSIALGYSKVTESDASISYVGGYSHEAVFSVLLTSALILAVLRQMLQPGTARIWGFLPLLLAVQVALANYRTTILSAMLPLVGFIYFHFLHRGIPLAKVAAAMALLMATMLLATVDFSAVVERFAEIGTVVDSTAQLIKSPQYYTEWEQDYFSARVYIWSQYIDAYVMSDTAQHLIGLGSDTWDHHFRKYAHNTFVSLLYELGLFGCIAITYIFARTIMLSLSGPLTVYSAQLFLCMLGFLTMNLGTMPLWQIEGMILFAILSALAWELKLSASSTNPIVDAPEEDDPEVGKSAVLAGDPT